MKYYENAMKSTLPRRQGNPKRNNREKTSLQEAALSRKTLGKAEKAKPHKG
jgi:hypothetical protein